MDQIERDIIDCTLLSSPQEWDFVWIYSRKIELFQKILLNELFDQRSDSLNLNFIGKSITTILELSKKFSSYYRSHRILLDYNNYPQMRSLVATPVAATSLLHQKAHDIRQKCIPWQSYHSSQMISDRDFKFISRYEKISAENRAEFIEKHSNELVETFLTMLSTVSKDETIRYILCLINEIFLEDGSRVELFHSYCAKHKDSLWKHYFSLIFRDDEFIQNMTALLIAKSACWTVKHRLKSNDLTMYLNWLIEKLRANTDYIQSVARCLQLMLRVDSYRSKFDDLNGLAAIFDVFSSCTNFQIQYQLIFCIWICTFDLSLVHKMSKYNAIPKLADILSESIKEKVIRMILATFRNLIEKLGDDEPELARENAIILVQCKVLKHLEILQQSGQKFDDPDIKDDIDFLYEKLQASIQDLSSFDEYATEIRSGRLEWSPVHTTEKFWRENAARLNEKNYELLKILIRLLEASKEPMVLAVAAHDIGEYVRHYPRGKVVIETLGGKRLVMQLLSDNDANVRYEALLCVQKLMVQNWEYLGKQLEKETLKKKNLAVK
ncbi:V-type proton ATPase subunit H-like protein [Sarcoptes scabiei]|uniref:V-type proton ATPase subunit H-like protein n=1 Tax=Sarcoptes scabiei TaxID=52283 RepID=A0A132A308_SARSC|nr:V-type proton ATPase subunit H-like protein [Sarcoptes scabiei]